MMAAPRATYRLQLNDAFTFGDAAALAPYLAALGVSHLYASPWLKARAGSSHGYDIIDHNAFNPELGGEAGFEQLHQALRAHGLGHILDFVSNHMGVAGADNPWWLDVLEWGRASPWARYFDIDWKPVDPRLRNKVLLPFLGDHYGAVLERGKLEPRFDPANGTFSVWYYEHRFPLAPRSYAGVIRAGIVGTGADAEALTRIADAFDRLRLRMRAPVRREQAATLKAKLASRTEWHGLLSQCAAAIAGTPGEPRSFRPLHGLLEHQAYRLAYWRVAAEEINYRRFFDINDLAGIRVEDPRVFEDIHRLVGRLLAEGKLDGLRIDHVDGLYDPAQYLGRLRRLVRRPFYLVVEKILAHHERLRDSWPVDGTTGYDFMNQVAGLLVDTRAERALTQAYRRFTGRRDDFEDASRSAKKQVIENRLSSELHVLARALSRIAERDWRTRDYALANLARALEEVVAAFPVYRTYVDRRGAAAADRRDVEWAVAQARKVAEPVGDIFDFVAAVLTGDLARNPEGVRRRRQVLHFAMKCQQYTAPVMAKGFEDTALYRYHRLTCLNDVGGDPHQFGISVAAFHHANLERAARWPHGMLATATHDSKRGEDTRARLAALAAIPREWVQSVQRWARINRSRKHNVDGQRAPDRNDEYLLYQTLVGAWPSGLTLDAWDTSLADDFGGRIQAYMTKALREAKLHSSWVVPNDAYESATADFVARILNAETGRLFLDAFLPFQQRVAELGVDNSLVQVALKLTCPGVPDIYQGSELWDLNLVDPDNRRPVDFAQRARMLAEVQALTGFGNEQRLAQITRWRRHWQDGAIKLYVLHRLLQLRAVNPALFDHGGYQALDLGGVDAGAVIGFARWHGDSRILVAARLRPDAAGGIAAALSLPLPPGTAFTDLLTGNRYAGGSAAGARLFQALPVAVLAEKMTDLRHGTQELDGG